MQCNKIASSLISVYHVQEVNVGHTHPVNDTTIALIFVFKFCEEDCKTLQDYPTLFLYFLQVHPYLK